MPLWPGTGIPYGISPFALSAGTAEARSTVGVTISSLMRFIGCSSGVGDAPTTLDCGEGGRRAARFVFFSVGFGVGRGWKAFETDSPTFLKKSPIGSAFTHRPLNKNSAATGNETQRERKTRLIRFFTFNVKTRFSIRSGVQEKEKTFLNREFGLFKTDNATAATAVHRQPTRQRFRYNRPKEC